MRILISTILIADQNWIFKNRIAGTRRWLWFWFVYRIVCKSPVRECTTAQDWNFPSKEKPQVPIPREPISPQIREMTLKYFMNSLLTLDQNKLSDNVKTSNDQIYHLHPFGNSLIFDKGMPSHNHLLPQFNDEGYMIIGLINLHVPMELSLYFELEDNIQMKLIK